MEKDLKEREKMVRQKRETTQTCIFHLASTSECTVWAKHLLDTNEFEKWPVCFSTSAASQDKQVKSYLKHYGKSDARSMNEMQGYIMPHASARKRTGGRSQEGGQQMQRQKRPSTSFSKANGDVSKLHLPFHWFGGKYSSMKEGD